MQNLSSNKSTLLSERVKQILNEKGFSFSFNWSDYQYFKAKAKNAFNKAVAIAEMFIEENGTDNGDFNQYVF